MFTPHSLGIALLMMIGSALFWGSWANTYKGVKNYRFELFYWDYAIGIFLISLILALTMGNTGNDASSFLNNVRSADPQNIAMAMIGGAKSNPVLAILFLRRRPITKPPFALPVKSRSLRPRRKWARQVAMDPARLRGRLYAILPSLLAAVCAASSGLPVK